jgi:hypothetical protein
MVAIDFDLKFTYVLARWAGFAHDALVLADVIKRQDGLKVPKGKGLVHKPYLQPFICLTQSHLSLLHFICRQVPPSECWLRMSKNFMSPYRGVHYHFSKYGAIITLTMKESYTICTTLP